MIITRAPFRITLGGGGTDLPSFYRNHGGMVFAMGIDKYVNVLLNATVVDSRVRLSCMQSELVEHASDLKHPLVREALLLQGIERAIEISSVADLPARAGVGSSGSFLVALLLALRNYLRRQVSQQELAEEACHIEIDLLSEPVGKQDQYMASFGGLRVLEIDCQGRVSVRAVNISPTGLDELVANSQVFYTGVDRSASEILRSQNTATAEAQDPQHQAVVESLQRIKELGYRILEAIETEDFDRFGLLMDTHWQAKKQLSSKISHSAVDRLYEAVKERFGVLGGKIIGAGGGGFLMLYCPKQHRRLTEFMAGQGMYRLSYGVEFHGARVVADLRSGYQVAVDHRRQSCGPLWRAAPALSAATQ